MENTHFCILFYSRVAELEDYCMINIPEMKVGIVAVSRDCFPESLSVNRRKALVDAYAAKYDSKDIYECPVCIQLLRKA